MNASRQRQVLALGAWRNMSELTVYRRLAYLMLLAERQLGHGLHFSPESTEKHLL